MKNLSKINRALAAKKKLLTLVVCSLLALTANAGYITTSGNFSNGGTWKIENGILEVHATTIPDYKAGTQDGVNYTHAPWNYYRSVIHTVRLYGVSRIGENAFSFFENLRTVKFYEKSYADVVIGNSAFRQCFLLSEFDFTYVKEIGNNAFFQCVSLESVILPNIQTIRGNAFYDCTGLYHGSWNGKPSIWLTGANVPTIEKQQDLSGTRNYMVFHPKTGKQVGNSVIPSQKIIIVATSTTLKSSLESYLNNNNIHFREDVRFGGPLSTSYDDYWYINRDQNTERECVLYISKGGNLDYTSETATPWYSVRSSIERIYFDIPGGYTRKVGKNAFKGLTNLVKVDGANRINEFGENAFRGCSKLTTIDLEGAKKIGANAFASTSESLCSRGIHLTAAEEIGDNAFDGVQFETIYFGENLQNVGQYAFRGSFPNGGNIYVFAAAPATGNNAFQGASSNTKVHVDMAYISGYQASSAWSAFQMDVDVQLPASGNNPYWVLAKDGTLTINDNSIPNYASESDQPWYNYREFIKKVVFGPNVSNIGKNALAFPNEGESNVTSIEIPATVTTIGENAFKNNDQIEVVEAEGVKNIGSQAFENCSSLEKVKFGKDVKSLGNKVFNNCGIVDVMAVKAATPPTVTAQTFLGMGIVSSNAPAKVKAKAAARRAKAATGQKSVTLDVPDAHISKYLAAQYWNLFSFEYIGEHGGIVESDQAYDGVYVLYSDGTMIVSASAPTNPQDINVGFTISSNAKSKVKRVEIQGTLEKLGHQFRDCPNLEEVVLSGGITSLNGTFYNCPKLKTINLDNVTALKSHSTYAAFQNCTGLTSVNLPNAAEIGDNCFKGCTALAKVTLGGSCEIGEQAFANCTALQSIDLGAANLNGALQAFQGCTALKRMSYQGTRMPAEIFKGCTALRSINLGGQLKDILSEAFASTAIDTIYVQCPTPPEAATNAFSGLTPSSIRVYVPAAFDDPYWSAPVWEDMFFYDDEDYDELDFPIHFAIGSNGWGVVDDQGNLTINAMGALDANLRDYVEPYAPYINNEIHIGNDVTSLPAGSAFKLPFGWVKENTVRYIVLGSGLLELGDYALYNNVWDCDLIVDCYALNPPVMKGANVFNWSKIQNGSQCVATLNVVNDAAVEAAYRADTYWKKFSISSWLTPADAPAECTVTFVDWDGTILQQTTTRPGMMVTPPADPVRDGYTFKGWDSQDYTWVVSDLTITATYYDETYTVRFYDWDGTLLSEQQVHYGQAAEAPADPAREGYTFLGWSEDFSDVTIDKYIVAMYHNNDHEGIEDIQPDQVPNIKVMIDGVLYIVRDGKIYNILGTEVR